MNQYRSHQHIPDWVAKMDGELLTSAELDVFDFLCWCKKYGCRTSNDHIGKLVHHEHYKVQEAIMKFYRLELVVIQNFGKRTRCIKVAPWPDRRSWESRPGGQGKAATQPAPPAPHISSSRVTPTGLLSREEANETSETDARNLSQGQSPRTPTSGSVRQAQFGPISAPKHKYSYEEICALVHRDKLVQAGWTRKRANAITLAKFPNAGGCLQQEPKEGDQK